MNQKYWDRVIEKYQASGQRQEDFCKSESVPLNKFKYYWQKHRAKSRLELSDKKNLMPPTFEAIAFNKVSPINSAPKSEITTSLSLTLTNRVRCDFDFKGSTLDLALFLKEMSQ